MHPTTIPFQIQHTILEALQRRLEHAAFGFYQKNAPELLEKQKWVCTEEVEWSEWLKFLLKPEHKHLLPDLSRDDGNLTARDVFKQTFDIRHSAVHRDHVSSHDLVNFTKTARDILIAFNDSQGALMAHKYIAISLEVASLVERNNEEIHMLQNMAEREAKRASRTECLSIRTRLEDRIQSQLQLMSYITSTVEFETPFVAAASLPQQELPLMTRNTPRAICCTVWQIGRLLLQESFVSLVVIHVAIIIGMLCALQCMDN